MKILAIDPGYDRMGMAVVEGTASRPSLCWSDCVTPPKGDASERLAVIYSSLEDAIARYRPDVIAIEKLFFNINKKTALGVAEARGAVLAAAGSARVPVREYSPQEVKNAVTGYGGADKAAVGRMVARLLTLSEKRRVDDELDAVAVGITALALANT